MFSFTTQNNFSAITRRLEQLRRLRFESELRAAGRDGVRALAGATPRDTGETAASWDYQIKRTGTGYELVWINTHMGGRSPVAILLQYGHGTGTGGYVQGVDYINPAMSPVFEDVVAQLRKRLARE